MSDERDISQLLVDARELIGRMKNQYEINAAQLKGYDELITKMGEMLDKRMTLQEKAISAFRNTMIVLVTVFAAPIVFAGIGLQSDVNALKNQDNATKTEVLRSLGVIIDEGADALEDIGEREAAEKFKERSESGVTNSFGYKSRGVKK